MCSFGLQRLLFVPRARPSGQRSQTDPSSAGSINPCRCNSWPTHPLSASSVVRQRPSPASAPRRDHTFADMPSVTAAGEREVAVACDGLLGDARAHKRRPVADRDAYDVLGVTQLVTQQVGKLLCLLRQRELRPGAQRTSVVAVSPSTWAREEAAVQQPRVVPGTCIPIVCGTNSRSVAGSYGLPADLG
jgi:hypothetical protein